MIKRSFQKILIITIIGYCVYSSFGYLNTAINIKSFDAANRRFEERIKNMNALLPFKHGIIGYFSDENVESIKYDSDNVEGEYILTQYSISPIILNKGVYHEWNILNMSTEAYEIWSMEHGSKFKLMSSGGGFYLIHRTSQ
jgi:ABC-type transport system involved in Fe-S cluster assembly fused permease/ATPase subunit